QPRIAPLDLRERADLDGMIDDKRRLNQPGFAVLLEQLRYHDAPGRKSRISGITAEHGVQVGGAHGTGFDPLGSQRIENRKAMPRRRKVELDPLIQNSGLT